MLTRFYSPSLKDVAWLKPAQFIFLISHTFVCKFGRVEEAAREKNYRQMYEKLEKLTERLLSNLHPLNLVNTIFYLVAIHKFRKIQFWKKLFVIGFPHTAKQTCIGYVLYQAANVLLIRA